MSFHQVSFFGRAVADTKIIEKDEQKKFAAFSVAVNGPWGKDRSLETTFYECLVFGKKQIEAAGGKVKKGDWVYVTGRPSIDTYMSKSNEPKANIRVMVADWQALDRKNTKDQ